MSEADAEIIFFQFPLLGFLLCILVVRQFGVPDPDFSFNSLYWDFCSASVKPENWRKETSGYFQFPLLGFLLCINAELFLLEPFGTWLSIPFIGIFALHLWNLRKDRQIPRCTFNSLYWDFCSASLGGFYIPCFQGFNLSIPFIGIFALHRQ